MDEPDLPEQESRMNDPRSIQLMKFVEESLDRAMRIIDHKRARDFHRHDEDQSRLTCSIHR